MKIMRKLFGFLLALACVVLTGAVANAAAPTALNTLTTTTLSSAISSTNGTLVIVASATGISAGAPPGNTGQTHLYVDNESMCVVAVSGTQITVQRGCDSTIAQQHNANTLVWIGNGDWYQTNPAASQTPRGTCPTSLYAYPHIHVLDGTWWACGTDGLWGFAGPGMDAYGARWARTTVADAAYTALWYDRYIAYSSISATRLVTLPTASSVPGKIYTIKDESGSATSMIKINLATVDGSSTFACVAVAYGSCTVQSNGTAWNQISNGN